MSSPTHQPYKDGKGGVDIGLKPINENQWLEIDNLFEEEIIQKKGLFVNKKDEVLVMSLESFQNQQNVLQMILSHLSHFYPDFYDISSDRIRVTRNNKRIELMDGDGTDTNFSLVLSNFILSITSPGK